MPRTMSDSEIMEMDNEHDVVLSQEGPRDAAVNFDTYRILQRIELNRAVSLLQHDFLVGLCLQTAVKKMTIQSDRLFNADK